MTALEVAASMGLTIKQFEDYVNRCSDVVEADHHVAILKGNEVHLAVKLNGLAGRRVLKECRETLARWFALEPFLVAPIRHGNTRAKRIAEALGFTHYANTATHLWMAQSREQFND
jgi:hypothetical protein